MVTTTPKLRADLHSAEVVESDGVLYYDVSDPVTGGVLRLFDYEWLIAQRLDGQRGLDEIARWTSEQFGFAASRDDIAVYAERLGQLGLVEGSAVAAAKALPAVLYVSNALQSLGIVAGPAKAAPAAPAPAVTAPAAAPPVAVAPAAADKSVSKPPMTARPADKLPEPGDRRASRDEDAMMGQPMLPQRQPVQPLAQPQRPTPMATPVAQPSAPAAVVTPPPAEPAAEPPSLPQAPISRAKSDVLAAIESLPPPVEEPAEPKATEKAPPAALQPEPAGPVIAKSFAEPETESTGPRAAAKPGEAAQIPIEQEPVARPTEPLKPVEAAPAAVAPPSERPTVPLVAASKPETTTPVAVQASKPVPPVEKPSSAGKWFFALIVVAALIGAAYYWLALRQPPPPPAIGVKLSVAKAEDVTRSFPTPAVVKKTEPQALKIDGDGTVLKVEADGTAVEANAVLVQLDGQTKVTKELADLKERLTFYGKKLAQAKAKGKKEQERDAEQKINDKQKRLDEVEAIIKKSQLVAPRAGTVGKALVKAGQAVTAGTEVVSFADNGLAAEIKIPAIEAQGMKVGQDVSLAGPSGAVAARVASLRTEGEYSLVGFALTDNTTAKVGDELKLQKAPLTQVVRLPAAVLLEGNKVYVARDGRAVVVPVTIADRDGDTVLVQGLPGGDQVITSRPPELHEGVAVRPSTEP